MRYQDKLVELWLRLESLKDRDEGGLISKREMISEKAAIRNDFKKLLLAANNAGFPTSIGRSDPIELLNLKI
jgi:hypothetical protein